MQRDFCIYCGSPFTLDKNGKPFPCTCSIDPKELEALEKKEQEHLAESQKPLPLTMRDMERTVETETGPMTVQKLLGCSHHKRAIREAGMKTTGQEIIQLVYYQHKG